MGYSWLGPSGPRSFLEGQRKGLYSEVMPIPGYAKPEIRTREHFNTGWIAILTAWGTDVHISAWGETEEQAIEALRKKLKEISDA